MSKSNPEKRKEEKEPQFPNVQDCKGASGAEAIKGGVRGTLRGEGKGKDRRGV